ncbi:protein inturned-like [Branchiostoma floridae]|uniref:Inturned planar cell polarity effector homolog n=1 Tax=Branchiostoma floridae TaxID=7739 RepID=A0A9J7MVT0_BRAFL|nr:protein inturned-like [Branchiostoma floridae]
MFASRGPFSPHYFNRKTFSDFDSINVILAKCTLPPVWADKVQSDGSLFYLEPSYSNQDWETRTHGTCEPLCGQTQGLGTRSHLPDEQTQDRRSTTTVPDDIRGKISRMKALIQKASKRKQKIVVSARRDGKRKEQTDDCTYDVWLEVDPVAKSRTQNKPPLERLLGILPGVRGRWGISVAALVPGGPADRSGQIAPGDGVVAVNDISVTLNNINDLLAAIDKPMEVKVTMRTTHVLQADSSDCSRTLHQTIEPNDQPVLTSLYM